MFDSKRTVAFRNFRGTVKVLTGSLDQQRSALAESELELAFNALKEVQGAFAEANQTRAEERRIREETTSKNLRNDCISAFRQLINFAQYNAATKGDESCMAFIDKVNVFIANSCSLYKARAKARAKAREGATPEPRDAAALALPVNAAAGCFFISSGDFTLQSSIFKHL